MNTMPYGRSYNLEIPIHQEDEEELVKAAVWQLQAEGKETLEQNFNRLQVIVSQLEFMDVEIEQDDLNQKLLTSLSLEWLVHTIVWRNRSDLDMMSLDDLYNHLKVYEPEVQKKSDSQNMTFISSSKNSSRNEEDNTAGVPTASTQVSTTGATVAPASISLDTTCAYIASQSNRSRIKYEDINQINEDDIEEMDIKWNMDLLSMRADRYWKKTWKKISIQGTDVAGFDKSKAPKAFMVIDGVGWDWSFMANEEENHALIADEEAPTEFALMAKSSADSEVFDNSLCSKNCKKNTESLNSKITDLTDKLCDSKNMLLHYKAGLSQVEGRLVEFKNQEIKFYEKIKVLEFNIEGKTNRIEYLTKELENLKNEKEGLESKLTSFKSATKDLDHLIGSQRSDKIKEGLGYSVVPPPPAQVYSPPKKDMSWTGLPEFADDIITDYTRPSPSVEREPKKLEQFDVSAVRGKKGKTCPTNTHKSTSPRPAVHKTHKPPMRPVRPNMNVAQPKRTSFRKLAHSYNKRPFQRTSAVRSQFRDPRVATVNRNFLTINRKLPTVNRKFSTSNTKFSTADMGNKGKAIKASACWFWKPSHNLSNKGNISYLYDYEPFDGGYVSFGQGGCKITGKGTIKTDKLEFKNVYFVKDLKTPRQHNMYSIDLNNIVPHKDLTCLVAKASADECMLWHMRLGHLNFKTMNKLVRHNLVSGLPTKCFENDHNCTACLKGKQHKESCKTKLDETSGIIRNFITEIENLKELKVKIIRCDNGENKPIEKGTGPNWLFDIDSLTNSMNNVPVVIASINSTNFSGTKEAAGQDVKKDVSSLR
nr:hypothetical protein [Tanacetum cinerariifolium]